MRVMELRTDREKREEEALLYLLTVTHIQNQSSLAAAVSVTYRAGRCDAHAVAQFVDEEGDDARRPLAEAHKRLDTSTKVGT